MESRWTPRRTIAPLVNAHAVEGRIKNAIRKRWQDLQREFKLRDPYDSGFVNEDDVQGERKSIIHNLIMERKLLLTSHSIKLRGKTMTLISLCVHRT